MKKRIITHETTREFRKYLLLQEKSIATIEKYCRDVKM